MYASLLCELLHKCTHIVSAPVYSIIVCDSVTSSYTSCRRRFFVCDSVTSSYTSCRSRFIVCGYAASSYADRVYTGLLCMSCCKKLHTSCRRRFIVCDSVTSSYTSCRRRFIVCDSVTSSDTSCRRRFIVCGYAASSYADRVYTGLLCMSCCKKLHSSCRRRFIVLGSLSLSVTSDYTHQVCAGGCIADLSPCRPSPRKVCNIADPPPEDL